jgi:hypothetical protein
VSYRGVGSRRICVLRKSWSMFGGRTVLSLPRTTQRQWQRHNGDCQYQHFQPGSWWKIGHESLRLHWAWSVTKIEFFRRSRSNRLNEQLHPPSVSRAHFFRHRKTKKRPSSFPNSPANPRPPPSESRSRPGRRQRTRPSGGRGVVAPAVQEQRPGWEDGRTKKGACRVAGSLCEGAEAMRPSPSSRV